MVRLALSYSKYLIGIKAIIATKIPRWLLPDCLMGLGAIEILWFVRLVMLANPKRGFYIVQAQFAWFDLLTIMLAGIALLWLGIEKRKYNKPNGFNTTN